MLRHRGGLHQPPERTVEEIQPMTVPDLRGGVDLHAHWLGTDVFTDGVLPADLPHLVVLDEERGQVVRAGQVFREVRAPLWDVGARLRDLDAAGIEQQVLSPVPVTFPYTGDRGAARAYAVAMNRSIAAAVSRGDGRLHGLGTVPLPHAADSTEVLRELMGGTTPLLGVEIGARPGGHELDSPALQPFFEAAEALGALVFVHPADGGSGTVRRSGQPYDFGLGMHADTALAAGALVFGGVLERFPCLRVVLAHGCGGFAWSYPRLRLGAGLFDGAPVEAIDERVRSLYVDTLVLDPEHLRLLVHRFGADRVVVGTDHPFFPDLTGDVRSFLVDAEARGALPPGGAQQVFRDNGLQLLGSRVPS
ncbi:aminocarboxymuconate-semialdehyde decarboxylase [Nocardioides sp. J9]|nr:aminocarboxymuconate-semialdehyde decarboxylase [Nocardioides sp. J9]